MAAITGIAILGAVRVATALLARMLPAAARVTGEQRLHSSQKMEPAGEGSSELSMEVAVNVELERWVLGWGGDAIVLKPPELAEAVKKAARKILRPGA